MDDAHATQLEDKGMNSYYSGRRARHYNIRWRRYTSKTLDQAFALIDFEELRRVKTRLGRPPCVLDVACGTGILLKRLLEQVPNMEAYGVDESLDMLAQARVALKGQPNVRVERAEVGTGETAGLPYAPETF